jgi:photosystem II stability/assembly factor-like uncharacterized protein
VSQKITAKNNEAAKYFPYIHHMFRKLAFIILISVSARAQDIRWQHIDSKTNASFRGMSVVDDSVAWVSGGEGTVGLTTNGGKDWSFRRVKGYENWEFRSLYAFDAKNAVIANAGHPAYILLTADGGATWAKAYQNNDTAAFIDGVDFWDDKNGVMFGDPVDGRMMLLATHDGGHTWEAYPPERSPRLADGEAGFAASGTGIRCLKGGKLAIATGGKVSRIWITATESRFWRTIPTPILQGGNSTGIFSFLPVSSKYWVIAGGDYKRDTLRTNNLFVSRNGGKSWTGPAVTTRGYRECVEVIDNRGTLIAVGPGGIDISRDKGRTWSALSDEKKFHVIRKSRKGNLVVMAGGEGKVAVLSAGKR